MVTTRSKSKPANPSMKFSTNARLGQGKISLPDPVTVPQMFVMMILHICRKIILFEPELKVAIYLGSLFIGGLIGDFLPVPKTYLSRKTNIFNVYFVKLAWGWTLLIVGSFIYFSSFIYCCGNKYFIKRHLSRLLVGTVSWFVWTNMFLYIEEATGFCLGGKATTKSECYKAGQKWMGFDISGHCFLLIYSSLLMMEEAKAFRNWENISELLRYEEHDEDTPLRFLTPEEDDTLKFSHPKYTPYVRGAFVAMTSLLLIWDVMLIGTILYFHNMVQKVMGGIIAISTWFVTYRFCYLSKSIYAPGLPGRGLFDYQSKLKFDKRRVSLTRVPEKTNGFARE